MRFITSLAAVAAAVGLVKGQAANESVCDRYTTALLMNNTAENQLTVLTLVVNTALIGNYTNPAGPAMNAVTGILNPGTYEGESVNLLPYFDGTLNSTNRDGVASSVNFLDGGGPTPLMNNTAANDTTSNQYFLVTHLYQLFGALLGCSQQNATSPFMSYQGSTSMSEVHRFMNLNRTEMNYFIQEVGLAATSFGVTTEDATAVGMALNSLFNFRCSPPAALVPGAANASQSVCVASDCPLAENSNCEQTGNSYGNGTSGAEAVTSTVTPSTGSSDPGSGSGTGSTGGNGASGLIVNAVGALALAAAGLVAVGL